MSFNFADIYLPTLCCLDLVLATSKKSDMKREEKETTVQSRIQFLLHGFLRAIYDWILLNTKTMRRHDVPCDVPCHAGCWVCGPGFNAWEIQNLKPD